MGALVELNSAREEDAQESTNKEVLEEGPWGWHQRLLGATGRAA